MKERVYLDKPVVAVGAVIRKENQFLLVKRGHEPQKSHWTIPGGLVELGESVEACLKREIREECGLDIRPTRLVDVIDYIEQDELNQIKYHYVIIDYEAEIVDGEVHADSDAIDANWFADDELLNLNLPAVTRAFLKRHYIK